MGNRGARPEPAPIEGILSALNVHLINVGKVLRKPAGSIHLTELGHLEVHTDQFGEVLLADSQMHGQHPAVLSALEYKWS